MEACLEALPAVSVMTRVIRHSCRPLAINPWLDRPVGIDTARLHAMACKRPSPALPSLWSNWSRLRGWNSGASRGVMEHAVALSLQQGESDCVTHDAMRQALHAEGLDIWT